MTNNVSKNNTTGHITTQSQYFYTILSGHYATFETKDPNNQ